MKTLIVTGGSIEEKFLKSIYKKEKFDYIIACDKGLEILDKANINPTHIIGDFDSVSKDILLKYKENKNVIIEELNPEKDYTDTHKALKEAIILKSEYICILGAIGTRFDHSLANINILKIALEKNIECVIINEYNKVELINKNKEIKKEEYKYISLLPLTSKVEKITLKGFKYPLKDATLEIGDSIGISNEQIEENAKIELESGILVIIRSNDVKIM